MKHIWGKFRQFRVNFTASCETTNYLMAAISHLNSMQKFISHKKNIFESMLPNKYKSVNSTRFLKTKPCECKRQKIKDKMCDNFTLSDMFVKKNDFLVSILM